jgi:DNA-directed RNA polymerase subunit RPC12/RpoP
MRPLRFLRRTFGSRTWRGEILGCLVEVRINSLGGETILIDGDPVSNHPWAYYTGNHDHCFEITGPDDAEHNLEIRIVDRSGGLQAAMRVVVNLDGKPLSVLEEVDRQEYTRCPHCGYDLKGLEPVNDEVQCPECGRHTSAKLLG